MEASPSVAIATIWDGNQRLACGIPLWCQGARLLSQQIPHSQVVLLSQQPSEDCAEATVVWSEETAAAAAAYVASHAMRDAEVQTSLLKFAMFSLSFDLVLQVDIDADLAPAYHPFRLDVWSRHIAAFMSSDFLFVGVPDHSSPVNGGVWLAKPRRWLYAEALALMRNCTFSFAHGFNDVGAPRSLRIDLGALQLGAGGGSYATDLLHRTSMFEHNDWKFTGGSLDQGLLFYLIYLRHNRGTWATSASMAKKRDLWKVSHFWGAFKPWRRSGKARANYLKRLAALPSSNETLTRCVREMRELEAELRREGAWEADDKLGWIPHEMPVLPALTVRERRPPPGRAPHPRYDAPAEEGGGRTARPAPALAARRPQGTSAPRVSGAPRVGVRSGEGVAAQGHEAGHGAAAESAPWLGAAALLLLLCVARVVRSSSHASGSRHLGHTRYAPVSQQVGDGNAGDGSASSERRGSGQTRARKY